MFGGHDQVSFGSGDLLRADVDAIVSPANSFGQMDGGIDRHYRNQLGLKVERRLQEMARRSSSRRVTRGSSA